MLVVVDDQIVSFRKHIVLCREYWLPETDESVARVVPSDVRDARERWGEAGQRQEASGRSGDSNPPPGGRGGTGDHGVVGAIDARGAECDPGRDPGSAVAQPRVNAADQMGAARSAGRLKRRVDIAAAGPGRSTTV
jgi:hypothetical protein